MICRNHFLLKHSTAPNVGSNIPVCRQAHIKLEVGGDISSVFMPLSSCSVLSSVKGCLYHVVCYYLHSANKCVVEEETLSPVCRVLTNQFLILHGNLFHRL